MSREAQLNQAVSRPFSLKLSQKAVIIIAVPLLCELLFVTILVFTLSALEKEYVREAAAKDVLTYVNMELESMIEAMSSYGMYMLNRDQRFLDESHASIAQLQANRTKLKIAMEETPGFKQQELQVFNANTEQIVNTFEQCEKLIIAGNRIDTMRGVLRLQKLLKTVRQNGAVVIEKQIQINKEHRDEQSRLRETIEYLIFIGLGANIALAVFLVLYFNNSTSKRLNVLSENATAFAMDKPLSAPLTGNDEIAAIDSAFHQMAALMDEARHKEQALTENATDVICSLDENNRFTKLNAAAARNWLYDGDFLLRRSLLTILDEEDGARFKKAAAALIENKAVSTADETHLKAESEQGQSGHQDSIIKTSKIELPIKKANGEKVETEWSLSWSEEERSFFCVAHDISERKKLERLKQEVTAMVSHDLRAPLTALQVTVYLLQEGKLGELNERGKTKAAQATELLNSLLNMIGDLLEMEKLESAKLALTLAATPAALLAERAEAMVQSKAEEKQIVVSHEVPDLTVLCDAPRIERVLVNLLHNAIKFSPPQSEIKISAVREGDTIKFAVSDQGRGISEEEQKQLFVRFKQLRDSDEKELKGSGLGLSICKAIVEAHKGLIGVVSRKEGGTTFWFTLPESRD